VPLHAAAADARPGVAPHVPGAHSVHEAAQFIE
jgi:hypothetical protein